MSIIKRIILSPYKYLCSHSKKKEGGMPDKENSELETGQAGKRDASPKRPVNVLQEIIKSVEKESCSGIESARNSYSQEERRIDHNILIQLDTPAQITSHSTQKLNIQRQEEEREELSKGLKDILQAQKERSDRPAVAVKPSVFKKCAICSDSLGRNDLTKTLACSHRFHLTCLNKSKRKVQCPLCNSSSAFTMNLTMPITK